VLAGRWKQPLELVEDATADDDVLVTRKRDNAGASAVRVWGCPIDRDIERAAGDLRAGEDIAALNRAESCRVH
jgi:hypothetical protein